jgi:hypothetical protein
MTAPAQPNRRRHRAMAVRQALRLCETELPALARGRAGPPPASPGTGDRQPLTRVITARAALRAAGVPPLAAAALRRRLRLTPEQEAE